MMSYFQRHWARQCATEKRKDRKPGRRGLSISTGDLGLGISRA